MPEAAEALAGQGEQRIAESVSLKLRQDGYPIDPAPKFAAKMFVEPGCGGADGFLFMIEHKTHTLRQGRRVVAVNSFEQAQGKGRPWIALVLDVQLRGFIARFKPTHRERLRQGA
jgi:hypothetical protein